MGWPENLVSAWRWWALGKQCVVVLLRNWIFSEYCKAKPAVTAGGRQFLATDGGVQLLERGLQGLCLLSSLIQVSLTDPEAWAASH